jgi:hypothetical protein
MAYDRHTPSPTALCPATFVFFEGDWALPISRGSIIAWILRCRSSMNPAGCQLYGMGGSLPTEDGGILGLEETAGRLIVAPKYLPWIIYRPLRL